MTDQQGTTLKSDDDDGYCSRCSLDSPIQVSKVDQHALVPSPNKPVGVDENDCSNKGTENVDGATPSSLLVFESTSSSSSSSLSASSSSSAGPSSFLEVMLTRSDWSQSSLSQPSECSSSYPTGMTSSEILGTEDSRTVAFFSNITSCNDLNGGSVVMKNSNNVSVVDVQSNKKMILSNEDGTADSFDVEPRKMIKLMPSSSSQNLLFYTRKSALGGLVVSSKPLINNNSISNNNNINNNNVVSSNGSMPKIIKGHSNYNSTILIKNNNPRLMCGPSTSSATTSSSSLASAVITPRLHSFAGNDLLKARLSLLSKNDTQCQISNGVVKTLNSGNNINYNIINNNNLTSATNWSRTPLLVSAQKTCTSARTSQPYSKGLKVGLSGATNQSNGHLNSISSQSKSCWHVGRHELHPIIDHDYCEFSTFNAEIQSGIILMSSETLARTDRLNLRRNKTISVLNSSNQSSNQSNHLAASLNCTHEQSKLHSIAAVNASKNAPHHSINSSIINTNNTNNNNYGKLNNATYKNIDASQRNNMNPSTASNKTSYGSGGRRLHTSASSSSLSSKNAVGRPKSVSQKMDRSQLKLQQPITSSTTVQQSSVGYDSSDDISSPPLTEDKNYVKIPGSYQNDFVYFATTRGRSSRKRSSERRSTNAASLASKAAGDTNNNSKITNNSSTLLGSTCYNKSSDDAVGRMATSSTSSALSTLNTFAWYKEMATTDKSTRFGTPSSSSQQQQQQQPQQFSTDTFNIDDMTNYLCSTSTEDYSNNNMTNKMLTSESDVVDLVMQMLPTSDLMLSPHVDLQQQPQQQQQHLFFNSSSSDVQQLQAQNLFFSTMSAPSIGDSTTDLISDSIISTGNIQNTNAEDYHCITGQQQVKKNDCDGADNTKTSGLRFTCDQTAKDHSLDFPNFTTSSQLLDEINDSDLLMTNDMPPCINDFFQVFHDSSSANDVSAIVDNHDDCNNENNSYAVVDNLGVNIKSEDTNVANISNYINDCSSIEDDGDINVTTVEDDHNNNSSIDVVNSDGDVEGADRSYDGKVDDQSQQEFQQHELVLTEPALNAVPTSTSLRSSYDAGNIDYNNNFDFDDSNIITHAQQQQHRTQSNKNQQYPQQMLEWPKHLTSSCQLSPPLSSPSSSLSSPSSQVTPPELTSVNVYWNDLPGLLINGHEYIRLVDIHKQIMPAKDTGILKKRCAMLNLKFTSCSELQRDFLIRYMNAAKSKSKIIVSKEAALMLISFYVNPKVRSSGHSKSSNAVTSAHQSQSRSKYGDKSGTPRNRNQFLCEHGSASGSPLHPSVNHNSSSSSTYFKFNQQDSASIKIICQPQTDKNKNASGVISANQDLSKTRTLLEAANQNLDHNIKRSARLQNKRFSYLDMVNNCLSATNKSATITDQHSNNGRAVKSPCSIKLTSPDTSPRPNKIRLPQQPQQQHDQSNKVHHRIKRSTNNYVSDDGDATIRTSASSANDSKGSVCRQQQTKSKSPAATTSTPAKMYTIHTRQWSHDHDNDNKQNHNDVIKITNSFNFNSSHESKIFAHNDNNNHKNIHNIGVVQPADAKTSAGDDDEDNNKNDVVVDDVVEKDAWAEEHGSPVDVTHERSGQQDLADVPLGSTSLEQGGASDRVSAAVRSIDRETDVNNACTANSNIASTVVDDDFDSINALVDISAACSALHTSNPSTSGDCGETKVPDHGDGGVLNHHQDGNADGGDDDNGGGDDDDTIPEIDVNEDDDDDSSEGIQEHVTNSSAQHFNASSSNNTCNDDKQSSTANPCRGSNNTHSPDEPLLVPSYSLRKRRASQSICEAEATAAATASDHPSKLSKRSCDSNSSKAVGGNSASRSSSTDQESNNLKIKVKKFVKLTKVRSAREIVRKRELRKVVGRPNRQANRRFAILKF